LHYEYIWKALNTTPAHFSIN